MCMERITDVNYDYFVKTMERLAAHPYSQSAENFLKKFLIVKQTKSNQEMILPLMHDEAGNPYMEAEGEFLFFCVVQFEPPQFKLLKRNLKERKH